MSADAIFQHALDLAEQQRQQIANAGGGDGWGGRVDPTLQASGQGPKAYGLAGVDPMQVFNRASDASVTLAKIKQYDPNAYIVDQYGSKVDGNGYSGGGDNTEFHIQFDKSKLPALPKSSDGKDLGNFGGYGANHLYQSGNVIDDPNYGPLTDPRNVKPDPQDLMGTIAPMVVAAIVTVMSGGTLSPVAAAMLKAPELIGNGVNGNLNAGSLASTAGSLVGLPGYANAAIGAGVNAAVNHHMPSMEQIAGIVGGAAGVPSPIISAGTTLAQFARGRKP